MQVKSRSEWQFQKYKLEFSWQHSKAFRPRPSSAPHRLTFVPNLLTKIMFLPNLRMKIWMNFRGKNVIWYSKLGYFSKKLPTCLSMKNPSSSFINILSYSCAYLMDGSMSCFCVKWSYDDMNVLWYVFKTLHLLCNVLHWRHFALSKLQGHTSTCCDDAKKKYLKAVAFDTRNFLEKYMYKC